MARLPRFGSALSAVALASMVAGCAAPTSRSSSVKAGKANLAYGLRAQMALGAGDLVSAVDLAEKAVESSPKDATYRALLGNVYFASGRFASAEAAYKDTLSLAGDPQVVLKLALVQIAQGKNGEALSILQSAGGAIEPADVGLAMALAGQPGEAIQVLEPAARAQGADSRVRQNLALAYALSGDWTAARTIAAQDLSAALVDSRIEQWMTLAKPARPSDQVAALIGVSPAAADPGQPVRLA
ncbi:MAG: tetratricopeptide repeat protein, partial [Sphingomicrobium sp.]